MKIAVHECIFPKLSIEEKLKFSKSLEVQGVEFSISPKGCIRLDSSYQYLKSLRCKVRRYGLEIPSLASSYSWCSSFTSNSNKIQSLAKKYVKRQIDIAEAIESPVVLILPGFVSLREDVRKLIPALSDVLDLKYSPCSEIISYRDAWNRSIYNIQEISAYAEIKGIRLAVENIWSQFLFSPLEMCRYIDEISRGNVEVFLDFGNLSKFGYPEHWIEILTRKISRVHIKDYKYDSIGLNGFCDLGKGDINFSNAINALEKHGYKEWISIEVPAKNEHDLETLNKNVNALKNMLARRLYGSIS